MYNSKKKTEILFIYGNVQWRMGDLWTKNLLGAFNSDGSQNAGFP